MVATRFDGGIAPEARLFRQAAQGGLRARQVLAGAARARRAWAQADARKGVQKAGKK